MSPRPIHDIATELQVTPGGYWPDAEPRSGRAARLRVVTDREVEILCHVLSSVQVEGALELLAQLRMLEVDPESSSTCRIYVLHPDAPRSSFARGERRKLPGRFVVEWPGARRVGEIGVWVEDGHLRALHYIWYLQGEPMTLPPARQVQVECAEAPDAQAGAPREHPVDARTGRSRARGRSRAGAGIRAALAVCVLAILVGAHALGASSGVDVEASRAVGTSAGAQRGASVGELDGFARGSVEGAAAGWQASYGSARAAATATSRADAYRRTLAQERQRLAAKAELAAAQTAASTGSGDATSCIGYRDARGYWICTT